jgi:uncharacterized protein (UPF0332 family)
MSDLSTEFLGVARLLISEAPNTPDLMNGMYRSAISRAYYAVFLRARDVLESQNLFRRTGAASDHQAIAIQLRTMNYQLFTLFARLRDIRNNADYGNDFSNLRQATEGALSTAELVLKHLSLLDTEARN